MEDLDRTGLLHEGGSIRKRSHKSKDESSQHKRYDADWDPSLPYGGKVYLARRKKPDSWWIFCLEILGVLVAAALLYGAYYYLDHMHYYVSHGYAHLGFSDAQHVVGQRLLHGQGVEKDPHRAMEWFKKAADQGHPEASYNLAIGHMKGIRKDLLNEGEPHKLIAHAASNGVQHAHKVLHEVCSRGKCV